VRVLAFARLRELLGFGARELELEDGATLDDVWAAVTAGWSEAAAMRPSTRFARNGEIVAATTPLEDGDEVLITGRAQRDGYVTIGFGDCRGVVVERRQDTAMDVLAPMQRAGHR